jgi:serralysin
VGWADDSGFEAMQAVPGSPGPLAAPAYLNADAREGTAPNGKPSLTIDAAAIQLTRESNGWNGAPGQGSASPTPTAPTPRRRCRPTPAASPRSPRPDPADRGGAHAWADVANINFVRLGFGSVGPAAYSNDATILFGDYATGAEKAGRSPTIPDRVRRSRPRATSG